VTDAFELRLERLSGYQFRAEFGAGSIPPLVLDEPPPLGGGSGPNPARLLAAAVGDCLSASLVFCLSRARIEIAGLETRVLGTYRRNERGRLRIGSLAVSIQLDVAASDRERIAACLASFEDYCVVTASVRKGIEVSVKVADPQGHQLFASPTMPGAESALRLMPSRDS
jgi:uncharacterized OsmC-like protein